MLLAGKKINKIIETPLNAQIELKIIFLLIFVERYPLNRDPNMLNSPIKDKIAAAVQLSKPLSITYFGTCVPTKVMWKPHTKKPDVSSMQLLFLKASFKASKVL